LKAFKYGKIEARIAAPSGQGLWPACWMLGDNFSSAGWPYCGEIDIFEHINKENKIYGTVHWDSNGHASYGANTNGIDVTKYHIYSITWDDDYIRWYVDSRQYHEILIKDGTGGTEEFQKEFFLLLNLAVGGNWPKSPDTSTSFPAAMYVDYIRVYKYNGQGGSQSTPDNPTTNPNTPANTDGIMRYTDKDKASASLSNIAWADIHYKVNNGVQMNIRMSQSGTTASYTISGLKKNDVVSYWFTNCDTSGFAKDGSKSIYKHTPEYTNLLLNSTVANSNISSYNALNMDTDVNSAFNKSSFISNSWYGMPNLWYPVFEQKLY
jgi:beta-glucanase (GH16 family)